MKKSTISTISTLLGMGLLCLCLLFVILFIISVFVTFTYSNLMVILAVVTGCSGLILVFIGLRMEGGFKLCKM
jgi:uncharacterized membrane protein